MLITYNTPDRDGDVSWRGTTEIFILNQQYKIRLYGTLAEISYNFYGDKKCTTLENVVDPIPSLQAVKNQADQLKTQTGTALTYEQYYELLLSAAMTNDNKLKS